MNKKEFNKLSIETQLEYINNLLADGQSLKKICRILGISKINIFDRFKKIGCSYQEVMM